MVRDLANTAYVDGSLRHSFSDSETACGAFRSVRIEDGIAMLQCSPAKEIHFLADRKNGAVFYSDGDKLLSQGQWEVSQAVPYVRAEVVDDKGNRAWANPIHIYSHVKNGK